ncbi:MAG: YlxR family protein [Clostridia bacterium]|nr:YlxR family protein [Clostridia bacterium]
MRACILCRESFLKSELLRIVKSDNEIKIDKTQKQNGRGAYICSNCIASDNLLKKRALDRAFKQKVPDEIYQLLKENQDG